MSGSAGPHAGTIAAQIAMGLPPAMDLGPFDPLPRPGLRLSGDDWFKVAELQGTGTGRMAGLAETYPDLPLGIVDATVRALS